MAGGPWPPSLPPDLYQPLEDTVVPMFFNCYLYLQKDPQIRNGFMEILPQTFSHTKPNSHLHVSTLAIAFFAVAAWTGQASLLRASEQYFTKALPKIREALQNHVDGELDDILMSILLLSTYEVNHPIKIFGYVTYVSPGIRGHARFDITGASPSERCDRLDQQASIGAARDSCFINYRSFHSGTDCGLPFPLYSGYN